MTIGGFSFGTVNLGLHRKSTRVAEVKTSQAHGALAFGVPWLVTCIWLIWLLTKPLLRSPHTLARYSEPALIAIIQCNTAFSTMMNHDGMWVRDLETGLQCASFMTA